MAASLRKPQSLALRAGLSALVLAPTLAPLPVRAETAIVSVNRVNQSIALGLNKSKVIDLPRDAHDIIVANPGVADAVTRTARRIYIFGKQIGQTNVFVFDQAGREIAVLDLRVERDISGLESTLRKYLPTSEIRAEMLNDNVVLTGTVENAQDATRAVDLARIYVTGGEATTNQYTQSSAVSVSGGVSIGTDNNEQRQRSQIVNLLQIQGEDQVTLKVTVAEVQRSVVKQLGLDGVVKGSIDGIAFAAATDNPFGLGKSIAEAGADFTNLTGNDDLNGVSGQLRALEQAGVMRTLAEPSLTAISGESASFKVGGEFSVASGKDETAEKRTPILNAAGGVIGYDVTPGGVQYEHREIDYGIGLDFTPVVLSPGRISLKIRTSVSEPTFESPFNVPKGISAGLNLIGIRKRLADTTVELPSGGSLVIAGLVRDETRQVISGLPGLAKLPVLGTLFRSRDFQRYETELVVIVTPYLVRPVARQQLQRPDDNLSFSGDGASSFLGRINRVYGTAVAAPPPGRYHGNVGYIYK
ncbi:type II and III secretion system protein family protein [Aureimonas jatrophae]|uniref:Pilus assembly protein CpaC n=1 Tax=Aureimonas jatrophae TaxID=1166073 RepID=A0A1H0LTQ0_9HYPH|nr:type II and III secretion system protein family protein [Aureimonas jatrophae]MBB3952746.1 pilus assembly protein CpaC [Aureimonas jatrophae]SDO71629.1 pilus assembly protein CpaC [Aureimonas jatrophae]